MNRIWRGSIRKKGISVGSLQIAGWLLLLSASGAFAQQLKANDAPAQGDADAVVITFTRLGPYPSSINHTAAPFALCIENRSGVLDDTFSVVQVSGPGNGHGPSLRDLHSTHGKQRDHGSVHLTPGTYQLISQAHPDWIVTITIGGN